MDTVLLGFIDQPISDTATVSWDTNKIGGSPVSTNVYGNISQNICQIIVSLHFDALSTYLYSTHLLKPHLIEAAAHSYFWGTL